MSTLKLSPTKVSTFFECPRRGMAEILRTVPGLPSIYGAVGTALHTVVNRINQGEQLTPEQRVKAFRSEIRAECIKDDLTLHYPPAYEKSLDFLREYKAPKGWTFLEGEVRREIVMGFGFELPGSEFTNFRLAYLLDACFIKPDGRIAIVDYKTKARAPSSSTQLDCYAVAESERNPDDPRYSLSNIDVYYWMTRDGGKLIDKKGTPERYEHAAAQIKAVAAIVRTSALAQTQLEARPGECKFCTVVGCEMRTDKW